MKLSQVIKIWDELHKRAVGDIRFCDLERIIEGVVGIENDISPCQPTKH